MARVMKIVIVRHHAMTTSALALSACYGRYCRTAPVLNGTDTSTGSHTVVPYRYDTTVVPVPVVF